MRLSNSKSKKSMNAIEITFMLKQSFIGDYIILNLHSQNKNNDQER